MKKIPRPVFILGLVSFFNDIASEMLYPILPIFITQVLQAPVAVVGIIEGVAEGTSALFKTYFGVLSDRLQKRKIFVVLGYFSSAIAKIIIALSSTWPLVFLGRFVDRFGKGVRTGARDALLLQQTDGANKGLIFGVHRTFDSAGAVIGPVITLILLQLFNNNVRLILYIAAIPSFVGILFLFFIKDAKKTGGAGGQSSRSGEKKFSINLHQISPKFKHFLLALAIFSLGNSSDAFLILRAKTLEISLTLVILIYILYNLIYALFSTPAGSISDKIGAKKVFLIGIVIFVLVYLGFAFNKNPLWVWILFAAYGFYIALTDGVSKALVGSYIKKEEAGAAYGLLQTVTSMFTLFASVIGGLLWSAFSPTATFVFGALCALVSFLLLLKY